jgi:predicted transposase YbfD/YdcC
MEKPDESRARRDEERRNYSKMDKRAKDKLVRSPRENGGG